MIDSLSGGATTEPRADSEHDEQSTLSDIAHQEPTEEEPYEGDAETTRVGHAADHGLRASLLNEDEDDEEGAGKHRRESDETPETKEEDDVQEHAFPPPPPTRRAPPPQPEVDLEEEAEAAG